MVTSLNRVRLENVLGQGRPKNPGNSGLDYLSEVKLRFFDFSGIEKCNSPGLSYQVFTPCISCEGRLT